MKKAFSLIELIFIIILIGILTGSLLKSFPNKNDILKSDVKYFINKIKEKQINSFYYSHKSFKLENLF